jgi:(2Fe-2S) ferredoxin
MPSCAGAGRSPDVHGEAIWATLRAWVTQHGLLAKVWVTKTGCLGWCDASGVTVMIYPEGARYRRVQLSDCPALIERHLKPLLSRRAR